MTRSTPPLLHTSLAAACAVIALAATGAAQAKQTAKMPDITVNGVDSVCSGFTTSVDTSTGGAILTCIPASNNPPPAGAPTGCSATINGGATASLGATGGAANLSVSCATPTSGISYNWSKQGSTGASTAASWTDNLPANTVSTALTYSYQVNACVGSLCTGYLPTNNPLTAVVAGAGGGGGNPGPNPNPNPNPAPGPWNGVCTGFSRTLALQMNWSSPGRIYTASYSGFGSNDIVVVAVTVPATGSTPNNNLARFAAAEYGSSPSTRIASLSDTPCDFNGLAYSGARSSGTTVSIPFAVGSGANFGYYPLLENGKTYYFNIKNDSNAGCAGSSCDIAIDLTKPPGV